LEPGEFFRDVVARQGGILDALVFVTNRRKEYIGGFGGIDDRAGARRTVEPPPADASCCKRIVAFAGTYKGVMHRIGYYAALDIKPALLRLRCLCRQHRCAAATPVQVQQQRRQQQQTEESSLWDRIIGSFAGFIHPPRLRSDVVLQKLILPPAADGDTGGVSDDIFREILEYL
jgi:hypothetical protein